MKLLGNTKKQKLKRIVAILLIGCIFFWSGNIAFVQLSTTSSTVEADKSVLVMTYNLHGFDAIRGYIPAIELIISENPDILALQEALPVFYQGQYRDPITIISEELNMTYFGLISDQQRNPSGVTILSKYPILDEYKVKLPSLDISTKYLVVTTIATPQGNVTVMGVHLELPFYPKIQRQQAVQVLDEIKQYDDLIFLCDCNAPDIIVNPAYRRFANHLQDAWITDGHSALTGNTWETDRTTLRVDYIWYKGNIGIVDNSVRLIGSATASDHRGLFAEIKV